MRQTFPIHMQAETFRKFAWFNTMKLRKAWRNPFIFFLIFVISSILCFLQYPSDGAIMLGILLLIIGIGLPVLYLINFNRSISQEIKKHKLNHNPLVYTLTFTEEELQVLAGDQRANYPWEILYRAYQKSDAIYLYVTPARGFILPYYASKISPENVWNALVKYMGTEKTIENKKQHT